MMARVLLLCFTSASALIAPRSTIARGRLVARAPRARAPQMAVAQYAGQAASLFNNMKTPASILAGALLPIGILTALPPPREGAEKEHAWLGALRELHLVIASASFCSELLSVMWATIAVNKLTETAVAPAESVFALLMRDCELPWVACNAVSCPALPVVLSLCEPPPLPPRTPGAQHFVFGMFGFMFLIGIRAFLAAASAQFGLAAAGWAASGLALMVSIVNRGVAAGGGDGSSEGRSVLALFTRYAILLTKSAFGRVGAAGPLELIAMLLAVASALASARAVRQRGAG